MRKTLGMLLLAATIIAMAAEADLTGAWTFSVELGDGGHGDPSFVLKQDKEKLTGTYSGPMGELKVVGTVTGDKAVFGFDFERDGSKGHATYTGTIDAPTKMHGTVEFKAEDGGAANGSWTATRK